MIRILGKIPKRVVLACSGGVDSMAILDFLIKGKRDVTVAHFHHKTSHGDEAFAFVERHCEEHALEFVPGYLKGEKPKRMSQEEFWRVERYKFLRSFKGQFVITCHHLDDCVETWLFGACHGRPKLIPYENNGIFRPFLLTKKETLTKWSKKHGVWYMGDPSNEEDKYVRNYIRHNMVPVAIKVNPGLQKTVAKLVTKQYEQRSGNRETSRAGVVSRKARNLAGRFARVWEEHLRRDD